MYDLMNNMYGEITTLTRIPLFSLKVYLAVEDTDCCTRNCCGNSRPFDMKVMDLYNNEIIHFNRPLACTGCCFPCCLQSIEISAPPGQVIGRVAETWTCWYSNFAIKNQNDETILRIEGPCCNWSCCKDINFKVELHRESC